MNPWIETLTVILLLAGAVGAGVGFSRLPGRHWLWGYCISLALLFAFHFALQRPTLLVTPPVSWVMMGQRKSALLGILVTILLITPMCRLKKRRLQVMVGMMLGVFVVFESIMPLAGPILNERELAAMVTHVDRDGVCRQNSGYTCGPASAVTALRLLGLPGEEGHLGILSGTSRFGGTPPESLAATLRDEYGKLGLTAEYREFPDIAELKNAGLTLAVISYGPMTDHYVTVIEVTDARVNVGDPLNGRQSLTYADFDQKWRRTGVVLRRPGYELGGSGPKR